MTANTERITCGLPAGRRRIRRDRCICHKWQAKPHPTLYLEMEGVAELATGKFQMELPGLE
jgi:hypothetical protein